VCGNVETAVVAKSSIVLDVKPWDDETDMADIERCVRSIEADGLLWGVCMYCCIYLISSRCISTHLYSVGTVVCINMLLTDMWLRNTCRVDRLTAVN